VTLSVVVCTHDRPDDLRRCLASLAALDDSVETIVVDSASRLAVSPIAGVRVVRLDEPGLSRARNAGLAAATGRLVAFVDDDATVAPDWARRIGEPFDDPTVGCVGGACLPDFVSERPRWLSERLLQYAGVTRFDRPHESTGRRDYPFGANVCFRREALADGFPEHLGRTGTALLSGEEVIAIDRVRERGYRVLLEPAAVVQHRVAPHRCRSSYFWRRLWWQGVTRARAEASPALTARLLAALPIRLGLYALTRDRVHLYRLAETSGYLRELVSR
jgi:cellulose synthase/poly-beta-1,6-N-acetylglucosamine synthase-like glycosyltransferase